ncbi:MAG: acid--CoA ligase, partial [Gammaproteobacteria bacterium]|nr:acid--CoA ligase [Gammaproteobacteria bacterium]
MATKHYDWVTHHAQIRPGKVAIVDLDNGREISYEQLDQRASRLASWFQANGVAKGDRVAVLLPNCPEFFEIQFACSKSG